MQSISSTSSTSTLEPTAYSKSIRTKHEQAACASCKAKEDRFEASDTSETEASKANPLAGFSLEEFRATIREELLQMLREAKESKKDSQPEVSIVSDIPYDVAAEEVAADVPEEWNAENTSQRIVDFALSFRGNAANLSDEEYIEQVRSAVQDGFRLAKQDMQALPGPSAKLFNNTYELTMQKLDKALADWTANPGSSVAPKSAQGVAASQKTEQSYSAVA